MINTVVLAYYKWLILLFWLTIHDWYFCPDLLYMIDILTYYTWLILLFWLTIHDWYFCPDLLYMIDTFDVLYMIDNFVLT